MCYYKRVVCGNSILYKEINMNLGNVVLVYEGLNVMYGFLVLFWIFKD